MWRSFQPTKRHGAIAGPARSPSAHAFFAARYRIAAEGLAAGIRRALAAGQLKPEADPDQVAREIPAVSDGLQVQWAIVRGRLDFVAEYHAYLDRLARTLTVDGRGLD